MVTDGITTDDRIIIMSVTFNNHGPIRNENGKKVRRSPFGSKSNNSEQGFDCPVNY